MRKIVDKKIENSSSVLRVRTWKNNLTIDFKGVTYTYHEVSKEDIEEIFKVESVGKFVHSNLKKVYNCIKETKEGLLLIDKMMKKEAEKTE